MTRSNDMVYITLYDSEKYPAKYARLKLVVNGDRVIENFGYNRFGGKRKAINAAKQRREELLTKRKPPKPFGPRATKRELEKDMEYIHIYEDENGIHGWVTVAINDQRKAFS